jgi:uncharacterized Zn-finger protein
MCVAWGASSENAGERVSQSTAERNLMNVQARYPKFHNAVGAAVVSIGCREFACVGDKPPQDHQHVYLNMGSADEIVCPYCGTIFRFDPGLAPFDARPAECAYRDVDFEVR